MLFLCVSVCSFLFYTHKKLGEYLMPIDVSLTNFLKFINITILVMNFDLIKGYSDRFLLFLHRITSNHYQNAFLPLIWLLGIGFIGILGNYLSTPTDKIVTFCNFFDIKSIPPREFFNVKAFFSTILPISIEGQDMKWWQVPFKIFSAYAIWNFIVTSRRNIK